MRREGVHREPLRRREPRALRPRDRTERRLLVPRDDERARCLKDLQRTDAAAGDGGQVTNFTRVGRWARSRLGACGEDRRECFQPVGARGVGADGTRSFRDVSADAPEHGADDGCSGVRVQRSIRRRIVFARPPDRRFQTLERVHATRRARQYTLPRRREHPPRLRVRVQVPALAAQTYPQPHRDANPLPRRQSG